jgi:hypothetical protein
MGDVGRNYSAQWRSYKGEAIAYNSDNNSFIYERHDQIKELIADMRENIMSTRLKVASWNPSEINKTALPPCHDNFQVIEFLCSIMKCSSRKERSKYFKANETRRVNKNGYSRVRI